MYCFFIVFVVPLKRSASLQLRLEKYLDEENEAYDDFKILCEHRGIFNAVSCDLEQYFNIFTEYERNFEGTYGKDLKLCEKIMKLIVNRPNTYIKNIHFKTFERFLTKPFEILHMIPQENMTFIKCNAWGKFLVELLQALQRRMEVLHKKEDYIIDYKKCITEIIGKRLKLFETLELKVRLNMLQKSILNYRKKIESFATKIKIIINFIKNLELLFLLESYEVDACQKSVKSYQELLQRIVKKLESSRVYLKIIDTDSLHAEPTIRNPNSMGIQNLYFKNNDNCNMKFLEYYCLFQNFVKFVENLNILHSRDEKSSLYNWIKLPSYETYRIYNNTKRKNFLFSFIIDNRSYTQFERVYKEFILNSTLEFNQYCKKNVRIIKNILNENLIHSVNNIGNYYMRLCNPDKKSPKKSKVKCDGRILLEKAIKKVLKFKSDIEDISLNFLEKYFWIYKEKEILEFFESICKEYLNNNQLVDPLSLFYIEKQIGEFSKMFVEHYNKDRLELFFDVFSTNNICFRFNKIFLSKLLKKLKVLSKELIRGRKPG